MPELDADRAALQAQVLQAVLSGQPVPGTESSARLADLHLTRGAGGAVRVMAEGLAQPAQVELTAAGAPQVELLTELPTTPDPAAPIEAVVRVRGPQPEGDRVDISVDVCALREGGLYPLETTTVVYAREGARWAAVSGPTTLAT